MVSVDTKPGNMVGPTMKGIELRLAKVSDPEDKWYNPGFVDNATAWENWLNAKDSDGKYPLTWRLVIVPVVQDPPAPMNGRSTADVVGTAFFFISSATSDGTISGHFIQGIAVGSSVEPVIPIDDYTPPDSPQWILSPRLIS